MGATKNVDMSQTATEVKVVEAKDSKKEAKKPAQKKGPARSKKYAAVRAKVDKTRTYDSFSAIELIKNLSYSNFPGTIEAHVVVKETGVKADVTFPHSTGKKLNVAIFNDEVAKKIEDSNIDFDILLATPADMKDITKHARILGPQGLMPNPKMGTLTDNPEAKKKELEAGKLTLKTEKKAPLIHTTIGKTDMATKDLVENLNTLIKALKGKLKRLHIAASMSPAVKVDFSAVEVEIE